MKKKIHRSAKGVLCCFLLLALSCENDNTATTDDRELAEGKKWFEDNNLNLEILEYTKKIDWDNAIINNGVKGKTIEVPLILIDNTSTNVVEDKDYKSYMRLLFLTDEENRYKVYNVVYTTKNEIFDNNNKEQNFYHIDSQYSGYITIQNSENKIIYSGEYEKGSQVGLHNFNEGTNETSKYVCRYWVYVGPTVTCSSWVWQPDVVGGGGIGGPPGISGPGRPIITYEKVDPCDASKKITIDSQSAGYLSAKNNILNANAGLEHSITLGRDASGIIIQAKMNTGGPFSVKTTTAFQNPFAALHNHPNKTPISAGDIYAGIRLAGSNRNFNTSFILTNGETYAIEITDLLASLKFISAYPADEIPGYNPEFPDIIFDQLQLLVNDMGSSLDGRTQAMAYILDKYNSGITLLKQDSSGKFQPFKMKQTGNNSYSSTPCN